MRLVHASSLRLCDFTGRAVPPYAILSHTWGEEEVSFKDMTKGRAPSLKGYAKILACCKQAELDYLEYVWIDTCCIDKRSSAELSEAINSMYRWYSRAEICYAYLADVTWPCGSKLHNTTVDEGLPSNLLSSRWFSRGWTLQELIAPPALAFYSKEWSRIGNRKTLRDTIAKLTGITARALDGNLDGISVAQKMSWASKRQTTRIEDEAYCLLGLFRVSMPLIYGEGRRAFRRLQEEIIKQLDDETIFAWIRYETWHGLLLASSPADFEASGPFECSDIRGKHFEGQTPWNSSPFAVTNKGVQISLPIIEHQPMDSFPKLLCSPEKDYEYERSGTRLCSFAILRCHQVARKDEYVAIPLDREKGTIATYTRRSNWLVSVPTSSVTNMATMKQILISTNPKSINTDHYSRLFNRRLIIIQPLPPTLAPVTFVRILEPEGGCTYGDPHFHDNNAISIKSPFQHVFFDGFQFYGGNPLVLMFKSSQGATVLISIAPTQDDRIVATISCGNGEADGDWCYDQASRDILGYENRQVIAKIPASGSNTVFIDVSAHVEDADHAWVVAIEPV